MARQYINYHPGTPRLLIFILTDRCNLSCVYCYERNKNRSNRPLSPGIIKERISREMHANNEYNSLEVVFFGGEPLLEFETIREVVEWFLSTPWPLPARACRFNVETNGTLLNDHMKKWFTKHKDTVVLSLSLDGTKEAHDRNRCGSYDDVSRHIGFFRQNWPLQPVKMTIGPDTIEQTYDGITSIHELGLDVEFDILFENVWGDAESERRAVRVWAEQLEKLVDYYHARPDLSRPGVLKRRLDQLFTKKTSAKFTFCGAGKAVTCVATDGLEYPCFRFTPLIVNEPLFDVFSAPDLENEQCKSCPAEWICTSCEGHNYEVSGSCFKRTDYHCKFFKISLLATARLMLLDNPGDLYQPCENQSDEERWQRMRRLSAVRLVDDFCTPVYDWAITGSINAAR